MTDVTKERVYERNLEYCIGFLGTNPCQGKKIKYLLWWRPVHHRIALKLSSDGNLRFYFESRDDEVVVLLTRNVNFNT